MALSLQILLASVLFSPAMATPDGEGASDDRLWRLGLERIESLYLWRNDLTEGLIMGGVVEQLERDIDWLMVDADGDIYRFFNGQEELGVVVSSGLENIEETLVQLEEILSLRQLDTDIDIDVTVMKGITRALDRHSRLLYGDRLTSFDRRLRGTLSGIGAKLGIRGNLLTITEVYPSTPSASAGLIDGDRIVRVDDISTLGMPLGEAVALITGDRGTPVTLVVNRIEGDLEIELELTLTREIIRIPNVFSRSLSSGVGYIRIDNFSEVTVENMRRELRVLAGIDSVDRGLVIDLRGNTGGSMIQSARAADLFLSEGELLRTEGPDGDRVRGLVHSIMAQESLRDLDVPLVVLQDHRTASGSEILAGALQEAGRALVIGTVSYGKGTVQKVYTLSTDARLKLTVARYLVAGYRDVNGVGLSPDLSVGRTWLDRRGMTQIGSIERSGAAGSVSYVLRGLGWGAGVGLEDRGDLTLELAHRIIEVTEAADQSSMISAAVQVTEQVEQEEHQYLVEQMDLRGIDWGPDDTPVTEDLSVDLSLDIPVPALAGSDTSLQLTLHNQGSEPIAELVVSLSSSDSVWDGRSFPVGWVGPGEVVTSSILVPIPASRTSRSSDVEIWLDDGNSRESGGGVHTLSYTGSGLPHLSVEMHIRELTEELTNGLNSMLGNRTVEVRVTNESEQPLEGLSIRLLHPEDAGVELTQYNDQADLLQPNETGQFELGVNLLIERSHYPMQVEVVSEEIGSLINWDFELPIAGVVSLSAPRIVPEDLSTEIGVGQASMGFVVSDESSLDSVVVHLNREKIAFVDGQGESVVTADLAVEIVPGENRFTVIATDDQGVERVESWVVRGIEDQ